MDPVDGSWVIVCVVEVCGLCCEQFEKTGEVTHCFLVDAKCLVIGNVCCLVKVGAVCTVLIDGWKITYEDCKCLDVFKGHAQICCVVQVTRVPGTGIVQF